MGGYEDWVRQRGKAELEQGVAGAEKVVNGSEHGNDKSKAKSKSSKARSMPDWERKELIELPEKIEQLE